MSTETKIVGAICLAFFVIIALLFWKGPSLSQSNEPKNPTFLVRENSHMTGKIGAKVAMVEFGDFECPACATVNPTLVKIINEYRSNQDFTFVFRNFPLPQHKNAIPAAEAAEAAGSQNKYFEMEELLYQNQSAWSKDGDPIPEFLRYAMELKLDLVQFERDVREHKFVPFIQSELLDGQTLQIDHTPTVFINGIEQKDLSYDGIKKKIDDLLALRR